MKRVKQADTPPERVVRRALSALGVRYRLNAKGLPGTPDIVNRARRWAIFVHGCYWHAHEGCPRWRLPKRNREFWAEKFEANRKRDRQKIDELENLGFTVLVVWQCELEVEVQLRERLDRWVGELL
jgi:DNA mismatch endonuclease (patch repair protein)